MATTTLDWIYLEREVADPTRFTHDLFACEELSTLETEKALWPELIEQARTGTAAYSLHHSGTWLTDVEPKLLLRGRLHTSQMIERMGASMVDCCVDTR